MLGLTSQPTHECPASGLGRLRLRPPPTPYLRSLRFLVLIHTGKLPGFKSVENANGNRYTSRTPRGRPQTGRHG